MDVPFTIGTREWGRSSVAKWMARTVLAAVVAVISMLASGSGYASATTAPDEAQLLNSSPENGQTIPDSPTQIVIGFTTELNDSGNTISLECETQTIPLPPVEVIEDAKSLSVEVPQAVPKGTCLVKWAIAATEDVEATEGSISFTVQNDPVQTPATGTSADGTATTTPASGTTTGTDATPVVASGTSADAEVVDFSVAGRGHGAVWLGRLLSTAGIAILFGALFVITAAWPEGVEYLVTIKFLRALWIFAVIGTLLFTAAAAGVVTPDGGGSGFSPATWLDLIDAGWAGRVVLLRLLLLLASGWVAFRPDRAIDPTSQLVALGIPALCAATLGISRTVGSLPALGVLMGVVHAVAMSIWLGGVILLARVVLSGPGEEDLVHAVRGFGRVSGPAMAITIISGVVQMMRLDGGALFNSGHGRVVVLKAVIVAIMIFVAMSARQFVAQRLNNAEHMTVPLADRLRRAFGAEAGIGVLTLAVSAWLLAFVPATIDVGPSTAYEVRQSHPIDAADLDVEVALTDDTVGLPGLRVDVLETAEGLQGLVIVLTAPANELNIGSIRQPVPLTGTGTAVRPAGTGIGLPISVAGNWTIQVEASTAAGLLTSTPQAFPVKDADGVVPDSGVGTPSVNIIEITTETVDSTPSSAVTTDS